MIEKLHWLGHSSFRWDGSRVIYFDPWKLPADAKKADIILVSHEHFDHFSKDDIARISTGDTVIVGTEEVERELKNAGVARKAIHAVLPHHVIDVAGVKIQTVPSYNIGKTFHTKDSNKVGYVVTMDGISVYHAGDTDLIPEMKNIKCDITLVPVSGTYVMTANEASEAVLVMKPKLAIPMHYGEIVGSDKDAKKFRDLLKGKVEVKILNKERK